MPRRLEPREPLDGAPNPDRAGYTRWLASRPNAVRLLAHEFPIGSVATVGENDFYVIGWTHEDLILSPQWIWPHHNEAVQDHSRCCVAHIRRGEVKIRRYRRSRQ
jgi:hypothetical protein